MCTYKQYSNVFIARKGNENVQYVWSHECLAHMKCLPPLLPLVETRQSYWVSLTLDSDWTRTTASSSHCHQRLPSLPSYFYFCFHSYNFYSPLQLLTLYIVWATHQRSSSVYVHTRIHTHADGHIHMHRNTHTGTATVPPTRRRLSSLPSLKPAKAQRNIPLVTNYHRQVYYAKQSIA